MPSHFTKKRLNKIIRSKFNFSINLLKTLVKKAPRDRSSIEIVCNLCYEYAKGIRSLVQNPPSLPFFFSVLSRDTVSVWYIIKKASGASKKYQNKVLATADFSFLRSPFFFVFSDANFESLQTEIIGNAVQHTCILFYIVHLRDLRCGMSEQVGYLLDRKCFYCSIGLFDTVDQIGSECMSERV